MMIKQLYLEIVHIIVVLGGRIIVWNCVVLSASYQNREIKGFPSLQKKQNGVLDPQIKSMESILGP